MMMMMHYKYSVVRFFCAFFFPNKKIIFFVLFFFSFLQIYNSLVSSRQKYLSQSRPFCCIHQKKSIHNTSTSTMGGVLSVPGGGGPAVEDVVALAESNDVPYAIPLPVNEVRLRLFPIVL